MALLPFICEHCEHCLEFNKARWGGLTLIVSEQNPAGLEMLSTKRSMCEGRPNPRKMNCASKPCDWVLNVQWLCNRPQFGWHSDDWFVSLFQTRRPHGLRVQHRKKEKRWSFVVPPDYRFSLKLIPDDTQLHLPAPHDSLPFSRELWILSRVFLMRSAVSRAEGFWYQHSFISLTRADSIWRTEDRTWVMQQLGEEMLQGDCRRLIKLFSDTCSVHLCPPVSINSFSWMLAC